MATTITTTGSTEQIVCLQVGWEFYQRIVAELGDSSSPRIAYDGEVLEIMAPGKAHESYTRLLDALLLLYTRHKRLKLENIGSTTLDWKPRGAQPDSTYYTQNATAVFGKEQLDLAVDPPPDLVLEVDISRTRINKFMIYSSIRIPEFWRYIGQELHAFALVGDAYVEIEASNVLPGLLITDLSRFMEMRHTFDQTAVCDRWLEWLHAEA